ncbi:MAG: hypothetical protein ACT4QA_18845 [Panacagrimonas sp.]
MKSQTVIAGGCAVMGLVAAAVWWSAPAPRTGSDPRSTELAHVRVELARLQQELDGVRAQDASSVDARAPSGTDPELLQRLARAELAIRQMEDEQGDRSGLAKDESTDAGTIVEEATPEQRMAEKEDRREDVERQAAAYQAVLETQLRAEDRDPQWSLATEERLRSGLSTDAFAGNQVAGLRCQSSLCRLDIRSADDAAFARLRTNSVSVEAFVDTQVFGRRTDNGDGSFTTAMYITRAGTTLPQGNK